MTPNTLDVNDVITITQSIPSHDIKAGQRGVIVFVHYQPTLAHEVEFVDQEGKTTAVLALSPQHLRRA